MKLQFLAIVVLFAAFESTANSSLVVNNNLSSPTNVDSVVDLTSGSGMVGMQVTADFAFGPSQTLSWAMTGPGAGGVTGAGWSLTQSGNTKNVNSPWTLTSNRLLTRLTIDALAGDTAFDRRLAGNAVGTPGSSTGRTISNLTGDGFYQVNATYRNQVTESNVFHGDLFGSLELTFSLFNFSAPYIGTLGFVADTDSIVLSPVPEPSAITLSTLAMVGFVSAVRRRRTRNAV